MTENNDLSLAGRIAALEGKLSDLHTEAVELRKFAVFEATALLEVDAYRQGNISRETLVERLEQLAATMPNGLRHLQDGYLVGWAWHDDSVDFL